MAKKGFKPVFTLDQLTKRGIVIINDNGLLSEEKKDKAGKIKHTHTVFNGVKYKSKLEALFAKEMTFRGIDFKYENITYEIVEGFKFAGKKIQPITYTPDFTGKGWIVEIKGYANELFPMRKKLFLKYLVDNNILIDYRIIKSPKEIIEFIEQKFNK